MKKSFLGSSSSPLTVLSFLKEIRWVSRDARDGSHTSSENEELCHSRKVWTVDESPCQVPQALVGPWHGAPIQREGRESLEELACAV